MTEMNSAPPDDTSTGMSRRQALWRSAALAAAGLLAPSLARAQNAPDTVDGPLPVDPVDTAPPEPVEAVDPGETLDWSVDPEEAPAPGAEAAYFEVARANEAADLADADEVHAETLDAAAIEFRAALEATKLHQAQETEESAIETAITAAPLDSAEVVALTTKLEQVRETYRLRQEQQLKARRSERVSERDEKQASKQVRRRDEERRKRDLAQAHTALLQELRATPGRYVQEARHKQRAQQRELKRRTSEQAAKARLTREADRAAMNVQQAALSTAKESLLQQRATRIKLEQEHKRRQLLERE